VPLESPSSEPVWNCLSACKIIFRAPVAFSEQELLLSVCRAPLNSSCCILGWGDRLLFSLMATYNLVYMSNRSPERAGPMEGVNNGRIDRAAAAFGSAVRSGSPGEVVPNIAMPERKENGPCNIRVESHSRDADPEYHTADDRRIELRNGGVLLDGMSGEGGGNIAAEVAKVVIEPRLGAIPRRTDPVEAKSKIVQILIDADERVSGQQVVYETGLAKDKVIIPTTEQQKALPGPRYIGSTVTIGAIFRKDGKEYLVVAWAGDSPGYLIRGGVAREIAPTIDRKNGIYHGGAAGLENFLGISKIKRRPVKVSSDIIELMAGDKVVLASDGVASPYNLSPEQIAKIVEKTPEGAAKQLVDDGWNAGKPGKRDDATVIVITPDVPVNTEEANILEEWGELGREDARESRRRGGKLRRNMSRRAAARLATITMLASGAAAVGAAFVLDKLFPGGPDELFGRTQTVPEQGPPESSGFGQPVQEIPRDFPRHADPDDGERAKPLPDPSAKAAIPPPEARPAVPNPIAEAKAPLVIDRDINVEGEFNKIPPVAGNDALKTIRKILKSKYQGKFNSESKLSGDEVIRFLANNGNRSVYGDQLQNEEQRRDRADAPLYTFWKISQAFPELKNAPVPPKVTIDYPNNRNLTPSRLTMEGSLPLQELSVASAIIPGNVEGRNVDEVPINQIVNAFGEVVSMDFIDPSSFESRIEGNRWRAVGRQKSDGASVEMVCAPDGRFTVRITQLNYKQRPGENSQLRVPQITTSP